MYYRLIRIKISCCLNFNIFLNSKKIKFPQYAKLEKLFLFNLYNGVMTLIKLFSFYCKMENDNKQIVISFLISLNVYEILNVVDEYFAFNVKGIDVHFMKYRFCINGNAKNKF